MNMPSVKHPGLSDKINNNIAESELQGGVWLKDVPKGKFLEVQTENTLYTVAHLENGQWTIQGHGRYCPTPTLCTINGSTWGGSMLKVGFIGRGMRLEFHLIDGPYFRDVNEHNRITTSRIEEITEGE